MFWDIDHAKIRVDTNIELNMKRQDQKDNRKIKGEPIS